MNDSTICDVRYQSMDERVRRLEECLLHLKEDLRRVSDRLRDLFWLVVIVTLSQGFFPALGELAMKIFH